MGLFVLRVFAVLAGFAAVGVACVPLLDRVRGLPGLADVDLRAIGMAALPGATACVIAVPAGLLACVGFWRAGAGVRRLVAGLCVVALLLGGWRLAGQPGVGWRLVLDLAVSVPIMILMLGWRIGSLDPVLMRSMAAAGAGPFRRFTLVVLPWLAWPAVAGVLLCLAATAGHDLLAAVSRQ